MLNKLVHQLAFLTLFAYICLGTNIGKTVKQLDSIQLSRYILQKLGGIDHLKLMKTIYFLDAFHLAFFGEELIDDEFEAWKHGPVSRKVYNAYKNEYKLFAKVNPKELEESIEGGLTKDQMYLIDILIRHCGKHNSEVLREASHLYPWEKTRIGIDPNAKSERIISKRDIKLFHRKQLANSENSTIKEIYDRLGNRYQEEIFDSFSDAWTELAK